MQLSDYTSEGVADRVKSGRVGVIVPLGATEQHGPHLPLDVDSTIAAAVAAAVAERLGAAGHDCVVAPVLPFGDSAHHAVYAGSVSLRRNVVVDLLHDICESFLIKTFAWVALVTGHAGNCWAMRDVAAHHARQKVISVDDWPAMRTAIHNVARDVLGLDADYVGTHAGHFETSIMLHLRPESVRMNRAVAGAIGDPNLLGTRLRDEGMKKVSPNGVIGDPTKATAEAGSHYLAALVTYNETIIRSRLAS
ncbi:MAG: mycofactocin biosynthesis peptidyl-dipeptidase MftE [Actinomycetota bacterium]|nr:mycofactocin biosynthesis peptidyl-dipeptidase MftE [Actinomycetota bacterium]